jgi:hypothetical protein
MVRKRRRRVCLVVFLRRIRVKPRKMAELSLAFHKEVVRRVPCLEVVGKVPIEGTFS